jgi:peptide/nickel transport system substrate-binding protein
MQATEELSALSDKVIQFKLKKPFPLILHALARPSGSTAIIMPEKLAQTPENVQVRSAIGSGPFRFAADQWVSGSLAVYERFADYVPRADSVKPQFTAGPKRVYIDQVRWQISRGRASERRN